MRYTEDLEKGLRTAAGKLVRQIVQEEIAKAFGALGREAGSLDSYDTGELESAALSAIGKAADGTVARLTCPHETYESRGGLYQPAPSTCRRCGEPEPALENPFEDKAPDPGCNHAWLALEDGSRVCQLCEGVRRKIKEKTDGTS